MVLDRQRNKYVSQVAVISSRDKILRSKTNGSIHLVIGKFTMIKSYDLQYLAVRRIQIESKVLHNMRPHTSRQCRCCKICIHILTVLQLSWTYTLSLWQVV
jgi:hypothetical protein